MKTICPIHRFSYSGVSCPFCEKERLENLAHRFVPNTKKIIKERKITESDIERLKQKFGNK